MQVTPLMMTHCFSFSFQLIKLFFEGGGGENFLRQKNTGGGDYLFFFESLMFTFVSK